jgi:hypothetical protein
MIRSAVAALGAARRAGVSLVSGREAVAALFLGSLRGALKDEECASIHTRVNNTLF